MPYSFRCKGLTCFLVRPLFGKGVYEALQLSGWNLVNTQMPNCRINAVGKLFHSLVCGASKIKPCVLRKPLFRQFLKLDRFRLIAVHTGFLKHHRLPVQLLLYLPFRHTFVGSPRHRLLFVIAVFIVTQRHPYLIRAAALSDCCHKISLLSIL